MQPSPTQAPSATGELIASFRHGKGFLMFSLIFGVVLLGLAVFVLYLGTILPAGSEGPVAGETSRGLSFSFSSPQTLIYATSALLAVIALGVFAAYAWHKRLRAPVYNVFELGIERIVNDQRHYTAFADIEDLYLFGSGQTAMTGMITNLAYRRNASEPFHRVIESLKGFYQFQQLVRERHVLSRMPAVVATLEAGGSVTFNCINSGQVWGKRVSGNFLKITTSPILVSRTFLHYKGENVSMASLRTVDLNAWTENVVIKDESGKVVLSTIATGILSHDVFLNTLDALFAAQEPARELV
ncbi:hypothetical protein VRB50_19870 [Pseudomonas poae]|uniref:hypothetical protein n=1 Tax=Pseudomonas TaxID=286 RepID=UPI000812AF60|nr:MULTISPECIES: hypothetical protein [Pseudomonas]MCF5776787.1 hypothetical protein [Pseudomonas poae]CRM12146.1 hypothetical protein [Pseudomonas sp. 25 E 4]